MKIKLAVKLFNLIYIANNKINIHMSQHHIQKDQTSDNKYHLEMEFIGSCYTELYIYESCSSK
jgi:hypothetical protein